MSSQVQLDLKLLAQLVQQVQSQVQLVPLVLLLDQLVFKEQQVQLVQQA